LVNSCRDPEIRQAAMGCHNTLTWNPRFAHRTPMCSGTPKDSEGGDWSREGPGGVNRTLCPRAFLFPCAALTTKAAPCLPRTHAAHRLPRLTILTANCLGRPGFPSSPCVSSCPLFCGCPWAAIYAQTHRRRSCSIPPSSGSSHAACIMSSSPEYRAGKRPSKSTLKTLRPPGSRSRDLCQRRRGLVSTPLALFEKSPRASPTQNRRFPSLPSFHSFCRGWDLGTRAG
jgi:hypothetical protein